MDRYSVLKRIGVGTYGSAYLAESKTNSTQCVLKKVKIDEEDVQMRSGGQQGGQRVQAIQEVQVLSSLDHPLILTYIDHFVYKGHLCIVTDYCEHGDLWQLLCGRSTPLAEVDILDLLAQILLAIQYVHSQGILHRDLKSQNIFLTREGTIKLGDFGISRSLNSSIDLASTIIGTPYYMSPEVMGSQPYDFSSDMWSLGCILYEMMSLKHAFDAADLTSLVLKVMRGEHLPIPEHYSPELKTLAKQLLSKSPKTRPSPEQCLKLPVMRESVARARAKVDKASRQNPNPIQIPQGNMKRRSMIEGGVASGDPSKTTTRQSFYSRGQSERNSSSWTPEVSNSSPANRGPVDIDRELAQAKERLRLIQAEREALRGCGPPPMGQNYDAASQGAKVPAMHGRRKSIGNPNDDSSHHPSTSGTHSNSAIHHSYSEPPPPPPPHSSPPESSNPKARMEARKQEEARRRESELLEARKQYFEERRLAETKGKSNIYGTSAHGSSSFNGVRSGGSGSGGGGATRSVSVSERERDGRGSNGNSNIKLREDQLPAMESLALGGASRGGGYEEEDEMEATRDFELELSKVAKISSVQSYYSVGGGVGVEGGVGRGLADKAEALRSYCKEALGPQVYDLIYAAMRRRVGERNGATDDQRFRQELKQRLGPSRMQYVHLVDQIIFFEDSD